MAETIDRETIAKALVAYNGGKRAYWTFPFTIEQAHGLVDKLLGPEPKPEPAYDPIPLDLTDPRLAYLLDPTADIDEKDVVWEREYREKDMPPMFGMSNTGRRMLDGCARCQNGLHWQCHGCSCPCSNDTFDAKYSTDPVKHAEWVASVRAIGPYPDRGGPK